MDRNEMTKAWQEYEKGVDYNTKINYYVNVDKNWSFYNGDQWRGVVSNGLPTPVFNIVKRVINYFIASIMSRKVKGQYVVENVPDAPEIPDGSEDPMNEELRNVADLLSNVSEMKWEKDKMDSLLREALLDAANSGDMCAYVYWDSSIETGQEAKGDFVTELVDGGNVMFGNPNERRVDKQPYIIISGRDTVKNLKEEAKRNGVSEEDILHIVPDESTEYQAGERGKTELDNQGENGKCNYVLRFWKQDGRVWFSKSTRHTVIRKAVDMGIRKYPIAFGNWEQIKNSYHGQAVATGIIPNQIYINKQFAMTMLWLMNMAYGRVAYDKNRISSWSNQIGVAQPVDGDITGAIQQLNPGSMNAIVLQVIDKTISYTKDMLGANDAALGDVNAEQASGAAIIATQKQASVPLENVQASLYQFVEDIFLIWGEFYLAKYNADRQMSFKKNEKVRTTTFNSTPYQALLLRVKVDVGPSSYWSEIASMQSLDNLLNSGKIDIIQYLERLPNGIIPKKSELIEEIKANMQAQAEQEAMMQEAQMMAQQQPQQPEANPEDEQRLMEAMAQFMEQLPPDVQQQLQQMPPDQMEEAILDMMEGGGGNGQM